MKLEETFKF